MPIKVIFEFRQKAFYKRFFFLQFFDFPMTLICSEHLKFARKNGKNKNDKP